MNYRADIDGLRAIAVLAVVIFHLDVPGFHGGFVGVDVFFVISGYLITSIIKQQRERGSFQLANFYYRRIRRLFPPLITTVFFTFVGAALIMTPYDLAEFSRSAVAALFSLSNIVFYLESGYWDSASELKPLLHTWSLGVEEQFYLFWPALILGLLAIRQTISFGSSLFLIFSLGAALCIWFTTVDQSAAFYLLPFRIFQFALGALLIPLTAQLRRAGFESSLALRSLAFWAGLFSILLSIFTFGGAIIFPGWAVLLPTTGAALVLLSGGLAGKRHPPARMLMENPLSTWLGKVSYSMYLAHWPLISLFRYRYGLELSLADKLVLTVATLLATIALHYGVERRFYHRGAKGASGIIGNSGPRFMGRVFAVAGILALVATSAWQGDGWMWRFPSLPLSEEDYRHGMNARARNIPHSCSITGLWTSNACNAEADIQVLVLGNSHELDGFNFLNAGYGADERLNLIRFGDVTRCENLRRENNGIFSSNEQCQARLDLLFDAETVSRLNVVLYAANRPYDENKSSLLDIMKLLKTMNPSIKVITLGGYINTKRPCSHYINMSNSTDTCALPENVSYFEDDPSGEYLFSEFRAIESHYIDRVALLCESRVLHTCRTRTDDGTPAFYDTHHNSLEFAEMSGRLYAKKIPDLLHNIARQ